MKLYSIQLESGEILSQEFATIGEAAAAFPDAEEIKRLDRKLLRGRVEKLNADLASVTYFTLSEIDGWFERILTIHGFGFPVESIFEIGRSPVGKVNVDIGGAFMLATWYRMPSGKFEIVAYAS